MNIIVDYGLGNLGSVIRGFNRAGIETKLSRDLDEIKNADSLIKKIVKHGLRGGKVTIYGRALYIYKVLPKNMSGNEIISITFSFK